MYSPKIKEDLVPLLYKAAKAEGIRMTVLVNRILEHALNGGNGREAKEAISKGQKPGLPEEDGQDHGGP
jgi:hypothetical protein